MAYPLDTLPPEGSVASLCLTLTATARAFLNPDGIPDRLKSRAQWVCWRYRGRGKGKPTKPPIDAKTGAEAAVNDAATWTSFAVALERFKADPRIAGIGYCLSADDGDLTLIDIDDYGSEPDKLAALALTWFAGTYAERSPSGGHAAHIYCTGSVAGKAGAKHDIFETYTYPSNRYLTVTGQRLESHAADITAQPEALEKFRTHCIGGMPLNQEPADSADMPDFDAMSEADIAELIGGDCLSMRCPACGQFAEYPDCIHCGADLTAKNTGTSNTGEGAHPLPVFFASPSSAGTVDYVHRLDLALSNPRTAALWTGDASAYGGDRSRAELALALTLLKFADGSADIVAGWMDRSSCGKWLERTEQDGYRASTLAAAIEKWDGKPFVDKWQEEREHGATVAAALLAKTATGTPGHATGTPGQTGTDGTCPDVPPIPATQTRPLFVPVSRFIGTPAPPQWTVKRWLPAASMAVLFGEPGCGKSFLAVDWCCHVATGRDWNGNRVKRGAVVYIAGEGHYGLKRRFATWQQQHGPIPDTLYVSERAVTLDAAGASTVLDAVGAVPEVPVLIVVDTLSSVIAGDENNAVDMNTFLTVLKKLLAGTAATILVVHHTGHGSKERARGHSSLKAALDAEFRAERLDGIGTLTCTKPKDMEPPSPLTFELTQVELPEAWRDPEEPDEPVTSCVFTVTGHVAGAAVRKAKSLPASHVIGLRALEHALAVDGGTYGGKFGVHVEAWRKAAYDGGIADGDGDAKKKAFQRVRQALLAAGHVGTDEDVYWLTDTAKQTAAALLNSENRKRKMELAKF